MLAPTAYRVRILAVYLSLAATIFLPRTAIAVDLYSQDFESVTLGPIVTYAVMVREREAWTATPPTGFVVDNSLMPGPVLGDPNNGVTEFEGWTFVDKAWWNATAGDQGRSGFFSGLGKIAVADNDTHDDFGDPDAAGPFDSKLSTPSIGLMGAAANTANLTFHSSWMPEEIQKATITARYNNGATVEVLRWHSDTADPKFHGSAVNETVTVPLQNPAGAASVILDFRLFDATNNWWWAIDNVNVYTGAAAATDSVLRAIVDRNTSNVKIVNNTGEAVNLRGYSIRSAAGAFNEPNATFLADSNPNWVQLTTPNATTDLSEGHLSSSSLANSGMINFGNNVWRKYFQDTSDLTFQYLVNGSDDPISGIVEFTGNGGASFPFLDLNFNGSVEIGDWDAFRAAFPVSLTGLPAVQRYQLGDLDNDGLHTANDFLRFKSEYNAAIGAGAFEAALAAREVPEPSTGMLLACFAMSGFGWCLRRRLGVGSRRIASAIAVAFVMSFATSADAQLTLFSENFEGLTLGPSVEEVNAAPNVWTDTPPAGWMVDDTGVPGVNNPPENNGMREWAGWAFTDKQWWSTQVDGQGREQFARGNGTVMVADPDEWDDGAHPDVNEQTGSTADCVGDTVNACMFDAFVKTPSITIPAGIPAGRIKLAFDSSWDDEGADDSPHLANNQRATVKASYNGGAALNILTWDSVPTSSPNYHGTAYNEAVQMDLQYNGTSTSVQLTFGLDLAENDWWWAVDNIRVFVPADPSILRVNTVTGQVQIVGGDVIPTPINFVSITSNTGALNGAALSGLSTRTPNSVDGPDPDATVGNSSGEQWQMLAATDNHVSEAFLFGSSTFTDTRTENLGAIFDTSTPVANRDLVFTYTNIFNDIVTGVVQYVNTPPVGVPGDYNNNGTVDAADYVLWRKGGPLQNEVDTPGVVNAADYTAWRARFGRTSGSGSSTLAAVPEPATSALAIMVLLGIATGAAGRIRRTSAVAVTACAALAMNQSASAAVPPPPVLDRDYRMGDNPTEAAVNGGNVSVTRDSAGVAGMVQLIHLQAGGSPLPKYELLPTVSGGPVPRRPDNGTGFAIRLNPTSTTQGQHLKTGTGQALNFPERSISSTLGGAGGTIDYQYIGDRGFQLWVLPQNVPTAEADIVMDTNQHGALIVNGKFAMRYANANYDTGVNVTPNTWYHLNVVHPFGDGHGSIMYVNGNAVAAATGGYVRDPANTAETRPPLVVGAFTSILEAGQINHFQGLVDDLEMAVMGLNASRDYGEFIFERDNKYAAFFKPANGADLTMDNIVNTADVDIFVDNWLYENRLNWSQLVEGVPQPRSTVVGDLASRMKGDFNFDGFVNLADWEILNDLAPPGVGAIALARINGIVPEPSCFALLVLAAIGGYTTRRSMRRHYP